MTHVGPLIIDSQKRDFNTDQQIEKEQGRAARAVVIVVVQ